MTGIQIVQALPWIAIGLVVLVGIAAVFLRGWEESR